ncbi:MAG: hypothetical protein ACYDHW_02425, partial [Syntrophorhabdaceae bacterium]
KMVNFEITIQKQLTAISIVTLLIFFIFPVSGIADWKVYYTGKAAKMFGSYGRGNFATKAQCEAYQMSRPGFERNNSYCSGYDTAPSPSSKQGKPGTGKTVPTPNPAIKNPPQEKVNAQESQFIKDKENLLGTIKVPPSDDGVQRGGTPFFRLGGGDPSLEARKEQEEFEKNNEQWIKNQKQSIEQRTRKPNRYVAKINRSLKVKAPPRLPARKYDELQPGDVILISRDDSYASFWINLGDRLTTDIRSPASHTVLYLKEVNGRKLFLDHTPGRGSHVIDEDEFLRSYAGRDMLVGSPKLAVAQPVKESEAARIWENAKNLLDIEKRKSGNVIDQTGYGLYGNNNLVCSEASRWVLIRSGREIPESASPLKRLLGIHYGPANFFSDEYNFIITPLWAPNEK